MRPVLSWFSHVLLLGACAADADVPLARASAPIINGAPLSGDLAVVALVDSAEARIDAIQCTGTLVSSHVVVAAAHCLDFQGLPPPAFVFFGDDPTQGGDFRKVKKWFTHPEYNGEYTADFRIEHDIGVVVLEDAAPAGAVPYLLASKPPTVGQAARFAGFGCREATGLCGPFGVKYQVTAPITKVGVLDFDYGVATCNGDSGGPALVMEDGVEVLGGVTSTGDPDCSMFGVDTRVDAFAPWVERRIAGEDPSTCSGADCPCAADGRCTVECARPGNDPDCPADCAADGACDLDCPEHDLDCPEPRADGVACSVDGDCASGVCEGVCRATCNPVAEMACPGDLSCEAGRFGQYGCVNPSAAGCGCRVGGHVPPGGAFAGLLAAFVAFLTLLRVRRRTPRGPRLW
jgi:MYXO-CTERM domain-containing protein